MARCVEYFTVHPDRNKFFAGGNGSSGIEGPFALDGKPFVFIQSLEILRIDDGVFSLSKRYPPEGVAVARLAVNQRQGNEKPRQPVRNRYGKIELNTTALHGYSELMN